MSARRFAIGVDLGGSRLRAALVNGTGDILAHAEQATAAQDEPSVVIDHMLSLIATVRAALPGTGDLAGVGIGSPGPLDTDAGVVIGPPTLPLWHDVPLRALLTERLGVQVDLDNDGNTAAIGEWLFGAGRGHRHVVYVTVSTGIGGGVISDGRVLRGRRGLANHVGHMSLALDGPRCICGNLGCWEALASGTALGGFARDAVANRPDHPIARIAGSEPIDARHIGVAARQGDPLALTLLAREAHYLGIGCVNLLHLFSPECIILGGGVSECFDLMEAEITRVVTERAMPAFRAVPVRRAELRTSAGVIGAAALVLAPRQPMPAS